MAHPPADDHRAYQPLPSPRPSAGALLPATVYTGPGAHRGPPASGVVGVSCRRQCGVLGEASLGVVGPASVFVLSAALLSLVPILGCQT